MMLYLFFYLIILWLTFFTRNNFPNVWVLKIAIQNLEYSSTLLGLGNSPCHLRFKQTAFFLPHVDKTLSDEVHSPAS